LVSHTFRYFVFSASKTHSLMLLSLLPNSLTARLSCALFIGSRFQNASTTKSSRLLSKLFRPHNHPTSAVYLPFSHIAPLAPPPASPFFVLPPFPTSSRQTGHFVFLPLNSGTNFLHTSGRLLLTSHPLLILLTIPQSLHSPTLPFCPSLNPFSF
jgi:hypothetical protein